MTAPIGIYVRVSRKGDREDDRFHSPREQEERARGLIEARGYVADSVFSDIDVSGATPPQDRPAMGALLEAIDRHELGGIAAYSLDRLSREPAHGDALVRRVTKAGGIILTPDIPDAIDSPTGEFTFGMLLQVAKLYRSQSGARFASAKERATLAGIPVGPVPVGYRQKADRTLEPDPQTAPAVREVFEVRARGGGYTALAEVLEGATGHPWARESARQVIRRRLYATGRLEYGGVVSEVDAGALVDEALWHAAQRVDPRPRKPRTPGKWLLTGLLKCESCTNNLAPWTGHGGKYRRYRCVSRLCPARVSVEATRLEAWVVARSFEMGDAMATRSEAPDLAALEEAVTTAERRLEQVMAPEARDALGDLWLADVKARREERDKALGALGEARTENGVGDTDFRLRDVWDKLGPLDRREALALIWRAIYVGLRNDEGTPLRFVARGPHAEAEVTLERGGGAGG